MAQSGGDRAERIIRLRDTVLNDGFPDINSPRPHLNTPKSFTKTQTRRGHANFRHQRDVPTLRREIALSVIICFLIPWVCGSMLMTCQAAIIQKTRSGAIVGLLFGSSFPQNSLCRTSGQEGERKRRIGGIDVTAYTNALSAGDKIVEKADVQSEKCDKCVAIRFHVLRHSKHKRKRAFDESLISDAGGSKSLKYFCKNRRVVPFGSIDRRLSIGSSS